MRIIGTKKEIIELLQERIDSKASVRDSYPKRSGEHKFYKGMVIGMEQVLLMLKQWDVKEKNVDANQV
jgi:hypothetical protein